MEVSSGGTRGTRVRVFPAPSRGSLRAGESAGIAGASGLYKYRTARQTRTRGKGPRCIRIAQTCPRRDCVCLEAALTRRTIGGACEPELDG